MVTYIRGFRRSKSSASSSAVAGLGHPFRFPASQPCSRAPSAASSRWCLFAPLALARRSMRASCNARRVPHSDPTKRSAELHDELQGLGLAPSRAPRVSFETRWGPGPGGFRKGMSDGTNGRNELFKRDVFCIFWFAAVMGRCVVFVVGLKMS